MLLLLLGVLLYYISQELFVLSYYSTYGVQLL